jgi:glycosyltransferase involved in cell wall biosynthesis
MAGHQFPDLGKNIQTLKTPMKILLIAYYFPPLPGPGSLRPAGMAKYLQSWGHDVFILTQAGRAPKSEGTAIWRIHDISHNCDRRGWRGIQWLVLRLAVEALNHAGIYASIYSLWKRAVLRRSKTIIASVRPQAIIATYPPIETLEIGFHLSWKYKLPLITDFRDGLLFEAIESKRLRRFACIRKAYKAIEYHVVNEAATLITVSEPLSRYFRETYGKSYVATVPNGFDPDETQQRLPDIVLEPGCFHIVHSGRFSLSDAGCTILPLVQALNLLLADRPELTQKLRLHFLGELSRREKRILACLAQRGVVCIHGSVSRPHALAFQRRADLLLLVTSPDRRSVATTKIFEYLQARRPILALTPRSFAAEIIEKCRCGWVVSPMAVDEIRLILERIISDRVFYQDVDLSAAAIADYSINVSLSQLNELLCTMDKNRSACT